MDFRKILARLASERPVFRSKEDFEQALHNLLSRYYVMAYKGYKHPDLARKDFDIFVELPDERIAIELFYKQRKLSVEWGGETFQLKNHAAQDRGRYEVLKDLEFLESCVRSGTCTRGAVILLTNDHTYWNAPATSVPTVDAAFRVQEGARLTGRLEWAPEASPGTMEGMEDPITIQGEYRATWQSYSSFPGKDSGEFRYLLFEVK